MAQQINLYDPTLLKKRDWYALSNIMLGAGIAAALVAAAGLLARGGLPELQARVAAGEHRLKVLREEVVALGQRAAGRKPDPRLEQELAAARQIVELLGAQLQTLRRDLAAETPPFAEFLRGLARQSMTGLWITGFAWDAASGSLEIRGRTTDPALLPEYLHRLNREPAFRGNAFAALKVAEGKAETTAGGAAQAAAAADAPQRALFHEFVLVPVKRGDAPAGRSGGQG